MLIAVMAAAVAAGWDTLPPGATPPAWFKKPTAEELRAVWPEDSHGGKTPGSALLSCRVNVHGVLEDCRAESETPPSRGFGAAAILLTPQLLFTPAKAGGVPVPSRVLFTINFKGESTGGRFEGGGDSYDPNPTITMINRPHWRVAATFADMAAAYPKTRATTGYAALRCELRPTGAVKTCEQIREEPTGQGFGEAAEGLARKFVAELPPESIATKRAIWVNLAFRFQSPDTEEFRSRHLGEPSWIVGLDPVRMAAIYPKQAAAKGHVTGRGVAECRVDGDGALIGCRPLPGDPDGEGFSEAAVKVASVMKMNLWTQDGSPVDGATIRLPIRFNLAQPIAPTPTGSPATL